MANQTKGYISGLSIRILFTSLFILTGLAGTYGQEQTASVVPDELIQANFTACLHCHSQKYFSFLNAMTEDSVKKRMCDTYVITPEKYYRSNHKTFSCADCHDAAFEVYPHNPELRLTPKYECLDCHGGDEYWADYKFEEIYAEYEESVHAGLYGDGFSCWSCHDPHEYHISARNTENIKATIAYDNAICLSCHANIDKYQLVTTQENPDIMTSHDWLPNQSLHFASVRCLECHTEVNDNILVAHKILPGDKAVKNCVECHSTESRLMETLYRFEKQEKRSTLGFYNGVLVSENSYVIGANRNIFLNVASIVIFGLTLFAIFVHILLRIIIKKK